MKLANNQEINELLKEGKVFNVVVQSGSVGAIGTLDGEVVFDETITTSRVIGSFLHDVQFKIFSISGVAEVTIKNDLENESISDLNKISAKLNITIIGDSIMAYGDGIGSGGSVIGPTSQSIAVWALSQFNTPYVITNRASGGATIDTVISGQLDAALADISEILWVHAGVNNLNPSIDATTPTVSEIVARMDYLLRIAQNVPLIILDAITPLSTGTVVTSGAYPRRADIPLVNAGYKLLASKYKNVIFNDIYTDLSSDSIGNAKNSMVVGVDGIHLTTNGAHFAGMASAKNISASGVYLSRLRRAIKAFALPRISGVGGTKSAGTGVINGDVATGYTVSIATNQTGVTVTASVNAIASKQRLRIQNTNANATVVRFLLSNNTAYMTGLANGDLVRMNSKLDLISNNGGLYRHDMSIFLNNAVLVSALQKSTKENGVADTSFPLFPSIPYSIKLNAEAALTATPTDLNNMISIEVNTGGDVTIDLYDLTIEEVVAI